MGLSASSVNLFTSSTLFGKVDTHLYSIDSIDYELHVSDTDIFFLSPSSLSFPIKQIINKMNEVWTMDIQLSVRIIFLFKVFQTSTLF